MAVVRPKAEIATIDVTLVTATPQDVVGANELAFDTASQIQVEPQINTVDPITLVIKGVLRAQKPTESVITSNIITLTDNMFIPEFVLMLQGGTIQYDSGDPTKIIGYTPPLAGSHDIGTPFTMKAYSAHYDAAGLIVDYECLTFPNCQGQPISFSSQDGVFRAPVYTITSAPKQGEAPYTITYVDALPVITDPV